MPHKPYYENDGIALYHGDCRDILPELQAESFDLVLTDPPYLVSYSGRWGSDQGVIAGDSDPNWVAPVYAELWRVLGPDSLCLTFYGWPHADMFLAAWKRIGFRPVSLFALIKARWGLGQFTRGQYEPAYLLAKGTPPKLPLQSVMFSNGRTAPLYFIPTRSRLAQSRRSSPPTRTTGRGSLIRSLEVARRL